MKNLRPIAVSILLLLPFIYVGSYLALVTPNKLTQVPIAWGNRTPAIFTLPGIESYRFGEEWAHRVYWPLEQADRKLFPKRWAYRGVDVPSPISN